MGKYLVPVTMVTSTIALAVSAIAIAFVSSYPIWWTAAIQFAVTGGFVPIIYAVNIRIVPVFARRAWRMPTLLRLQVIAALCGAWLLLGSRLAGWRTGEILGLVSVLGAALLFTVNIVLLFRQPVGPAPAPPLPYPDQARVDWIATQFTRISGIYLVIGLSLGLITELWPTKSGRWDLVWAHSMLVGFFLCMVAGVSYHVLSRWTENRWRSVRAVRMHFALVAVELPVMLVALALNSDPLFRIAGPMQSAALGLFLFNALPMVSGLPPLSRIAWYGAAACLLIGLSLGALFAIDPVLGARLRFTHAEINVFGWGGLLISGMGYYLAPRFAGCPLRWPRLAMIQVVLLASGVLTSASSFAARGYGHDPGIILPIGQAMLAIALLTFAFILAATFRGRPGVALPLLPVPRQRKIVASGPFRPVNARRDTSAQSVGREP